MGTPTVTMHGRLGLVRPQASGGVLRGRWREAPLSGNRRNRSSLPLRAEQTSSSSSVVDLASVEVVREAVRMTETSSKMDARKLFTSLVGMSKMKESSAPEDLLRTLADDVSSATSSGTAASQGGCFWKLVYTVPKDSLNEAASKGADQVSGSGGSYFPITAVQNWNVSNMRIQNGVFLGKHIFSLIFSGDFEVTNKRFLYFDFDRLDLKLGPLKGGFDLPKNESRQGKKRPFFIFLYADDEFCVAKGKGGGIAVWKKVDVKYRFENGLYV